jgi:VTC domain
MTTTLSSLRYEKKFVAEASTLADALATVRRHPAAFREVYPRRTVNNIYLDSSVRQNYQEHINGTAVRSKTRVRWYGPQWELTERPMLERKLKRGTVGGKEAYLLPSLPINEGSLRPLLETAFDTAAALPPILRSALRHLEPALFNRYQRHYFLSRDGKFRLTVDSNLQFGPVQPRHRPESLWLSSIPNVVLELKYRTEAAPDAVPVANALPFRVTRFSKYVVGIERI